MTDRTEADEVTGEPIEQPVVGTAEDEWIARYYERHPERAPKRKREKVDA